MTINIEDSGDLLPERRGKIRESNEKLDKAINHLSDVLDHIKIVDDKRIIQDQISGIRMALIYFFVVTWAGMMATVSYLFIHVRDQNITETQAKITQLRVDDIKKELDARKPIMDRVKKIIEEEHFEHPIQSDKKQDKIR